MKRGFEVLKVIKNIKCHFIPAVDEDLGVVLHAVSEDPEGPGLELLLLLGVPLLGGHLILTAHDAFVDFDTRKSEIKLINVCLDFLY